MPGSLLWFAVGHSTANLMRIAAKIIFTFLFTPEMPRENPSLHFFLIPNKKMLSDYL